MTIRLSWLFIPFVIISLTGCGTIGSECLAQRDYPCARLQAEIALQQHPRCCRCRFIIASADEAMNLPALDKLTPATYVSSLQQIDAAFRSALACAPKDKEAMRAAVTSSRRAELAESDGDPAIWSAIEEISDPDRRIRLTLAHQRYFGGRCIHDVENELRSYLGYLSTLDSTAIRSRLPLIEGTSISSDSIALAIDHRFMELKSTNDVDAWESARTEFANTRYAALLDPELQRALNSAVDVETDSDRVLGLCRRLVSEDDQNRCQERYRFTLRERLATLSKAAEIEQFCAKFDLQTDRDSCTERFQLAAMDEARAKPGSNSIALAIRACQRSQCRREALELGLRFEVSRLYQQFLAEKFQGPPVVKRSVQAWQNFLASMSALATATLGGRTTLETVDPETYAKVMRQIASARAESLQLTRTASTMWSVTRQDIHTWYKPTVYYRNEWLGKIDRDIATLITARQLDPGNGVALRLIRDLIDERAALDEHMDVQIDAAKLIIDFGASVILDGVTPKRLRTALTIGYSIVRYISDH